MWVWSQRALQQSRLLLRKKHCIFQMLIFLFYRKVSFKVWFRSHSASLVFSRWVAQSCTSTAVAYKATQCLQATESILETTATPSRRGAGSWKSCLKTKHTMSGGKTKGRCRGPKMEVLGQPGSWPAAKLESSHDGYSWYFDFGCGAIMTAAIDRSPSIYF